MNKEGNKLYLTWADRVVKSDRGFIAVVSRSLVFGFFTYAVGIVPLLATNNYHLIFHPLLTYPSIGVVWVCSMAPLVNWQKTLFQEATTQFRWKKEDYRQSFMGRYLGYVNNDLESLFLGFLGWLCLNGYTILSMLSPQSLIWLPIGAKITLQIPREQAIPFIAAAGIITLPGSLLAITAARMIIGQMVYAARLDAKEFDVYLTILRKHLASFVKATAFMSVAFSTGIAVILFALDLDVRNLIVIVSTCVVLGISSVGYVWVVRYSNKTYFAAYEVSRMRIAGELKPDEINVVGEILHDAIERMRRPVVEWFALVRMLVSIFAPVTANLFENKIWEILLSISR